MKRIFVFIILLTSINCNAMNFNSLNKNDSIKNELCFSQDRLGYSTYLIKYGRKISSDFWLKTGLTVFGDKTINEPLISTLYQTENSQWSLGLVLGIEKLSNEIIKDLDIVYGINSRFSYIRDTYKTDNPILAEELRTRVYENYFLGFGLSFGLFYNFNDRFAVGSEINPNFLYRFRDQSTDIEEKITDYQFNILSNFSILSIKYKW